VLLGLAAGVILDRVSRRPVLVMTDIRRGMMLAIICLMATSHSINIGWLIIIMMLLGLSLLTRANARLKQRAAVAQTSGPGIAGALISLIGAPFASFVEAVSYVFSGLVMASIKHQPIRKKTTDERLGFGSVSHQCSTLK
jgi:hypothetical protein